MNIRRVSGIAALVAAAATALVAPTVGAQTVTYGAMSDGQSLALTGLGQGLTAGQTHSEVSSDPSAGASGAGLLSPLADVGVSSASAAADGESDGNGTIDAPVCEGDIPDLVIASLDLACSYSAASISGGEPTSEAGGTVGTVTANPVSPLLDTPLADVFDQAETALEEIVTGLGAITSPLGDATGIGVDDTLRALIDDVLGGLDLATVEIGDTTSRSTLAGTTLTTECSATGAEIRLLDLPSDLLDPLVTITVGESGTSVVTDLTDGTSTPTADAALVTVNAPTLGPTFENIQLELGQTIELPLPDPLTSRIVAADGATGTNEDGTTFATASAVRVELLTGDALMGGITLALADCASVAGAVVTPATTTTTTTTTEPAPSLPRTGGTGANGWALVASAGLALGGLALLRRTSVA
ncbi:MAG: hypothetical protein OSA99_01175 [Acidimicrobiales bacterium]|nr:hypothetical protein [Acidimicrobiales bacterium]